MTGSLGQYWFGGNTYVMFEWSLLLHNPKIHFAVFEVMVSSMQFEVHAHPSRPVSCEFRHHNAKASGSSHPMVAARPTTTTLPGSSSFEIVGSIKTACFSLTVAEFSFVSECSGLRSTTVAVAPMPARLPPGRVKLNCSSVCSHIHH